MTERVDISGSIECKTREAADDVGFDLSSLTGEVNIRDFPDGSAVVDFEIKDMDKSLYTTADDILEKALEESMSKHNGIKVEANIYYLDRAPTDFVEFNSSQYHSTPTCKKCKR